MGKLNVFTISLGSGRQVFYPGEQLTGQVIVDLKEPMEVRGIKIEFEGKGYCHWTKQEGSGDNKHTVSYTGREKLCEIDIPLCGFAGGSGSRIVLPVGYQAYPFMINIPHNMPSSFEGSIGHIRYVLEAKIDKPWKSDDKVLLPIVINEVIDTNLPQYANIQPGSSVHKDVGCLCCAAGPIDMTANIDRACYCPGERILITADIRNQTTRDMDAVKAKLVQSITYHSTNRSGSRTHSNTITKLHGPAVPQHENARWDNQALDLPAMPPTIVNSRVVKVNYYFQIEVAVPWGLDPDIKVPVTIGTVPFRPVYGQQLPPPTHQPGIQADSLPPPNYGAMAPPPPSVFGYADMAPPSYASIAGQNAAVCGDSNLSFQPVYTFAQPSQVPITQQPGGYPPPQQQPGGYPAPPPTQQPGGYPAPQTQQPGGYPAPPQQPGGYPPPQQPGGYPAPPQQPGGYPPPQHSGPLQQPGGYPQPPPQQPGGYPQPPPEGGQLPPIEQPPFNPTQQQPGNYPEPLKVKPSDF